MTQLQMLARLFDHFGADIRFDEEITTGFVGFYGGGEASFKLEDLNEETMNLLIQTDIESEEAENGEATEEEKRQAGIIE